MIKQVHGGPGGGHKESRGFRRGDYISTPCTIYASVLHARDFSCKFMGFLVGGTFLARAAQCTCRSCCPGCTRGCHCPSLPNKAPAPHLPPWQPPRSRAQCHSRWYQSNLFWSPTTLPTTYHSPNLPRACRSSPTGLGAIAGLAGNPYGWSGEGWGESMWLEGNP